MIRTDPGSRSLGSDPVIRFRDPRTSVPKLVFAWVSRVEKSSPDKIAGVEILEQNVQGAQKVLALFCTSRNK